MATLFDPGIIPRTTARLKTSKHLELLAFGLNEIGEQVRVNARGCIEAGVTEPRLNYFHRDTAFQTTRGERVPQVVELMRGA